MDEVARSNAVIDKILNGVRNIKESLECRICLELFHEPVTIKCGHKFCRSCIQTVAKEENATCPFCNIKIHKRSIPKEGNELLELSVERFKKLKKALELDLDEELDFSKIQPAHKVQNTRESIPEETQKSIFNKPSTSRIETNLNASVASSVHTKRSSNSKSLSQNSRRLSLTRKSQTNKVSKTPVSAKKNAIDKYFSNQSNSVSDHIVQSDEKVSNWLKNITPDSELSTADNLLKTEKLSEQFPADEPPISHLEDNTEICQTAYESISNPKEPNLDSEQNNPENEDTNFEEIEKRILETEMKAKSKKTNQNLSENAVLKTTASVPAASHSDACDWRRIKRVGKEMQVKTFKSLNVSVEKSSTSLPLDETVPMQINVSSSETRDILKESDTNSSGHVSAIRKTIKERSSNKSDDLLQRESPKTVIQEYSIKHNSLDSSNSQREENISVSHIDKKQVNEIIGFSSSNVSTPEKVRNSNLHIPVYAASPLHTLTDDENQIPIDDLPNTNPPLKKKLSLKVKLPNFSSKSNLSQPCTPDKVEEARNSSPERTKSKMSLQVQSKDNDLPAIRTNKTPLKENSSTESCINDRKTLLSSEPLSNKNSLMNNCVDKSKISRASTRQLVTFKKVGRICKKKTISFVYLGSTIPKSISIPRDSNNEQVSNILIKSNVPVNIDYKSVLDNTNTSKNVPSLKNMPVPRDIKMLSPEKDSQLKFLTRESPKRIEKHISSYLINKSDHSEIPMEIDDNLPDVNIMSTIDKVCLESEERSKIASEEIDKVLDEIVNSQPQNFRIDRDRAEIEDKMVLENEESPRPINKKLPDLPSILDFDCELLARSPVASRVSEMEEDAISISSKESEPRTNPKRSSVISINSVKEDSPKEIKKLGGKSSSDSESSDAPKLATRKKFRKIKIGSSNTSSSLKSSPLKKKRAHSDSSEDEALPILAKWCETEEFPIAKKPRISPTSKDYRNTSRDQRKCNLSESSDDDIVADTPVQQQKFAGIQRDPPIDDIISKVKRFRETESVTNKMVDMPSSLLSADLFESEACIPPSIRTPTRRLNEIAGDNFPTKVWTSAKDSDKENLSDVTMLDMRQFVRNKSNLSESSDNSNKENNERIQRHASDPPQKEADDVEKQVDNAEDQTNEIGSSQNEKNITKNHNPNLYNDLLSESLMNITQEQLALKRIEDDLLGDFSAMPSNKATAGVDSQKFSTPTKKTRDVNTNDDFDTDNIEATPVQKRKHIYHQASRSGSKSHESVSPDMCTNLIPAVTPVRNTKSYPLSHSTPMINVSNPEETSRPQKIVLVCSQLQQEQATIAIFTKLFNATYQNTFDSNVTHVIVQTDPKTKAAQKTFKFIQGIALQKYVVSFQWIVDCLKRKKLLNPDDKKYEVLDPETFECGSKKSRGRTKDLFEEFACYCMDPFNAFSINDFKNILQFNGAKVVPTLTDLTTHKNKLRVVILESEELSQKKLSLLKKTNSVLVSYEWVVDSICQYHILSLNSYLCETTVERALECGFPPEYLVEDESVDENDSE